MTVITESEIILKLRHELKKPRWRLTEAEKVLEATQNGMVDGLVLASADVPQIYSLSRREGTVSPAERESEAVESGRASGFKSDPRK